MNEPVGDVSKHGLVTGTNGPPLGISDRSCGPIYRGGTKTEQDDIIVDGGCILLFTQFINCTAHLMKFIHVHEVI